MGQPRALKTVKEREIERGREKRREEKRAENVALCLEKLSVRAAISTIV